MKKIVVLEDDKTFRELIGSEINNNPEISCIASYAKIKELLKDLLDLEPDLFWLDISLPDGSSIDYIAVIKEAHPNALCLICSMHDDDEKVFTALKAGADGYLLKNSSLQKMMDGIYELFEGGSPMSPFIARKVLKSFKVEKEDEAEPLLQKLTKQEVRILSDLAQGYLYKEVADNFNISLETVKRHVQNIYKKLHVQNRTEAILKFLKK